MRCTTYESNVLYTLRFMVDCKVSVCIVHTLCVSVCTGVLLVWGWGRGGWATAPLHAALHGGLQGEGVLAC